MARERYVRMIAGIFILTSLVLAHLVSRYWLWFTAFVGFNLFQSSLTGFCPLEELLARLGIGTDEKGPGGGRRLDIARPRW